MSDPTSTINQELVTEYLNNHPDFIDEYLALKNNTSENKKILSFQSHQNKSEQKKYNILEEKFNEFIQNSNKNTLLLTQIHEATLTFLRTNSLKRATYRGVK